MATLVEFNTGQDAYPSVLERLRLSGRQQASRNGPVRQIDDFTIALETPYRALPVGTGRKLNRKIAVAEALQLIGGFSDPEWLCELAPQFKKFLEYRSVKYMDYPNPTVHREQHFHGAYGHRILHSGQLDVAVERLRASRYPTRQAVVTLWDPSRDTEPDHLDYPCTVAIGFSVRHNTTLDARVTMRSNDAWLGLPYDLFQFTQLQLSICRILDLVPGTYTHTAWSMHLYDSDYDASHAVTPHSETVPLHVTEQWNLPQGVGLLGSSLDEVRARAYLIHDGLNPPFPMSDSERWYRDVLAA